MIRRRAIVEIRWARAPVRRAVLGAGEAVSIGRSPRVPPGDPALSALAIPDDRDMSAAHCEIRFDGKSVRVRDLDSLGGTWFAGGTIDEAELRSGQWIRAGNTVIVVYVEGATPPRRESGLLGDGSDQMTSAQEEALLVLTSQAAPLFALLDAARDPRVVEVLHESVEPYQSLYEGIQGEALAMEAPYLVRLPPRSRLLDQLLLEGWGHAWATYLTCRRPFAELRTHLRRLLMVTNDETGKKMYFRFYDPHMLRLFVPICTPRQREQLFGEIEAFFVETKSGRTMRFGRDGTQSVITSPRREWEASRAPGE